MNTTFVLLNIGKNRRKTSRPFAVCRTTTESRTCPIFDVVVVLYATYLPDASMAAAVMALPLGIRRNPDPASVFQAI
jgi:hypothetical protein